MGEDGFSFVNGSGTIPLVCKPEGATLMPSRNSVAKSTIKPALRKAKPAARKTKRARSADKAATVMEKLIGLGMEPIDARKVAETVRERGRARIIGNADRVAPRVNEDAATARWLHAIQNGQIPPLV